MGHDYILQRMRLSSERACPIDVQYLDESATVEDSQQRVLSLLEQLPAIELNGEQLAWQTPDGGSLTFFVGDDGSILVDTHAGLDFVLEVRAFLLRDHPDWFILDPQTGVIHDDASLREQYAKRQRIADELRSTMTRPR